MADSSLEVLSCRGLRPECGKVDRDLWVWFSEARKKFENNDGPRVTKRMVQDEAKRAFRRAGISGFKASDGWYVRWIKRWRQRESISSVLNNKSCDLSLSVNPPTHVLHDIANKDLQEYDIEVNLSENGIHCNQENNLHPGDLDFEMSIPRAEDSSSLLDFDHLAWSNMPDLEHSQSQISSEVVFSVEESSKMISQWADFAEICNLKHKEMDLPHQLSDQSQNSPPDQPEYQEEQPKEQEKIDPSIHQDFYSDLTGINPSVGVIMDDPQGASKVTSLTTNSEFLIDTMFYSLEDDGFSILDPVPISSKIIQHSLSNAMKESAESCHKLNVMSSKTKLLNTDLESERLYSSVSDCILPNNAFVETVSKSSDILASNTDSMNAESTMMLFAPSPFNFHDDNLPRLSVIPDVEDTDESGYLHLLDTVGLEPSNPQNQMEQQMDHTTNVSPLTINKTTGTGDGSKTTECFTVAHFRRPLRGEQYLPCFKDRVVDYARQNTAREAAKKFSVNVDTVTLWTRTRQQNNPPKPPANRQFLMWVQKNRENGVSLTRKEVYTKVRELLQANDSHKYKNGWFQIWAERFILDEEKRRDKLDLLTAEKKTKESIKRNALYPDDFKKEVVLFASKSSQNLAASVFNIARKRVFDWIASSKKPQQTRRSVAFENNCKSGSLEESVQFLNNSTSKNSGKGFGRSVTSVAVDKQLWNWFTEQTSKRSKPKSREIREKALELFRAHNYQKIRCSHGWFKKWSIRHGISLRYEGDSDLLAWCLEQFDNNCNISHQDLLNRAYHILAGTYKSGFKASAGWALRFCKRHRNILSVRPSVEEDLPGILECQVSQFRHRLQELAHSPGVILKNFGAMDEVPLNFTAAGGLKCRGTKGKLLLRRSGLDNCHATVVLSCSADGSVLSPAVIFKGEGAPEWTFLNGVKILVFHQENACMDATLMTEWLKLVWFKEAVAPSVLIADCYDPHRAEEAKELCQVANCHLEIIPGGCSSKLQPLDIDVTPLFQKLVSSSWTQYFSSFDTVVTNKRAVYSNNTDILKWVSKAFSEIQSTKKEVIKRSFLITGLTVKPDHSQDKYLDNLSLLNCNNI